jgi:hypothetical protein
MIFSSAMGNCSNCMKRTLLLDIYNHLFKTGYPYRRSHLKQDIEEALEMEEKDKGAVFNSGWSMTPRQRQLHRERKKNSKPARDEQT